MEWWGKFLVEYTGSGFAALLQNLNELQAQMERRQVLLSLMYMLASWPENTPLSALQAVKPLYFLCKHCVTTRCLRDFDPSRGKVVDVMQSVAQRLQYLATKVREMETSPVFSR